MLRFLPTSLLSSALTAVTLPVPLTLMTSLSLTAAGSLTSSTLTAATSSTLAAAMLSMLMTVTMLVSLTEVADVVDADGRDVACVID